MDMVSLLINSVFFTIFTQGMRVQQEASLPVILNAMRSNKEIYGDNIYPKTWNEMSDAFEALTGSIITNRWVNSQPIQRFPKRAVTPSNHCDTTVCRYNHHVPHYPRKQCNCSHSRNYMAPTGAI